MSNKLIAHKRVTKAIILAPEGFRKLEDGCRFAMRHHGLIGCIKVHALLDQAATDPSARDFIKWALRNQRLFVDYKVADTPSTTHLRIRCFAESGFAYATVSTLGADGYDRLCAAVEAAKDSKLKILAVGELTTAGKKRAGEAGFYDAQRNGELAVKAGAHGVICGAVYPNRWFRDHHDERYRKLLRVAPGVGLPGDQIAADDQPPRNTPHCILQAGATHVVVQRGIGHAADPETRLWEYRSSIADTFSDPESLSTYEGVLL